MPMVRVKFFEHLVERTEEEIAELRRGGLLHEDQSPDPAPAGAPVTPPAKPDSKETTP